MRAKTKFIIIFCIMFGLLASLAYPVSAAPNAIAPPVLSDVQAPLHVKHSEGYHVPFPGTLPPGSSGSNSTARLNVSSSSFTPLVEDSVFVGPHVTLNGTWEPLDVPGFPTLKIKQTCLEFSEHLEQEHYGTIYPPVQAGWAPDVNPREAYDYVYLQEGQNVYIEVEFGTWTAGEGSILSHDPSDDIDVFVWAPGVNHTYANSLSRGSYGNPESGTFVAPITGNYTIGLDYYSGVLPMGWRCYVFAYGYFQGAIRDGRSVEYDTAGIGYNGVFDVRLRLITGTRLDADDSFTSRIISNVTIINFFPPSVTVLNPGAAPGTFEGRGLIVINWTGSDPNTDEVLQYTVEISNDLGKTWKTIAYTTLTSMVWDPTSAFYGLPPSSYEADGTMVPKFLVRVNVTDGRYCASDTSDNPWIITPIGGARPPLLELYIVVLVGAVVVPLIAINVVVFISRRIRPRKKH